MAARTVSRLLADSRGAHLVEYTLLAGCVGLVVLSAAAAFGASVDAKARAHARCVARLDCEASGTAAAALATGSAPQAEVTAEGSPWGRGWDSVAGASYRLVSGSESVTLTRVDFVRAVPESPKQLFEQMSKLAANKSHVKSVAVNEVASTIEVKLSRMAHLANNEDFALPIVRGKMREAKELVDRMMVEGYTPTQSDADALYRLIDRGQPVVTET